MTKKDEGRKGRRSHNDASNNALAGRRCGVGLLRKKGAVVDLRVKLNDQGPFDFPDGLLAEDRRSIGAIKSRITSSQDQEDHQRFDDSPRFDTALDHPALLSLPNVQDRRAPRRTRTAEPRTHTNR